MYPDSLKNLIECFKYFPGVGEKTAERMAFAVLSFDDEKADFLADSIQNAKKNIHTCLK